MAAGAFVGAILAIEISDEDDDANSKASTFLVGIMGGTALGFTIGIITKPTFKIVFPINKRQCLFEEEKLRLKEYVIY